MNPINPGGPVVLYRETFGAPSGADVVSTVFDWQSFESNGVARTAANINRSDTAPGRPADAVNTTSGGPHFDGSFTAFAPGGHYLQPARRLSFTPEFSFNPADFGSITFSWYQLNAASTRGTRLAIRVGSQWYVHAAVWVEQFPDGPLKIAAVENVAAIWSLADPERAKQWQRDLELPVRHETRDAE